MHGRVSSSSSRASARASIRGTFVLVLLARAIAA